ncbi:hypothetical protein C1645_772071 [Glomus cerebriforme]|uniref:Uncharacterized protein n=1 Tax=Glomus cerebriforme TaxID=658196 RepID=A0A397T3E0_9GLOM|nr:hypothetical protein C1645_772071 [Glomus cerebriforme]
MNIDNINGKGDFLRNHFSSLLIRQNPVYQHHCISTYLLVEHMFGKFSILRLQCYG